MNIKSKTAKKKKEIEELKELDSEESVSLKSEGSVNKLEVP